MALIDVIETKEMEDGSLEITIEIDEAGQQMLIQEGVISILKKHMEETNDDKDSCCGACCTNVSDKN